MRPRRRSIACAAALALLPLLLVAPAAAPRVAHADSAAADKTTAAEQLVRYLERQGVTKVFGVPGEETVKLVEALRKSQRIEFVLAGNEQGASLMATGYAKATGKVGVALSTLGPGATNLVTGAANAQSEGIKLLLITGQAETKRPIGYHQKISLTKLFTPVTTKSVEVRRGDKLLAATKKLFGAMHKKPGPVHLSLPQDVAGTIVNVKPIEPAPRPRRREPSARQVKAAAKLLRGAKKPVIVVGDGVWREDAHATAKAVIAFANKHGIPIVPSTIAKGMFPWSSKQVLPPLDAAATGPGADVVRGADVIVAVGYHPTETFSPKAFNPKNRAKVLYFGTEALPRSQRIEGLDPSHQIIGALGAGVGALSKALAGYTTTPRLRQRVAYVRRSFELALHKARTHTPHVGPLQPERVIAELRRALDVAPIKGGKAQKSGKREPRAMVFADIGVNKGMMTQWFRVDRAGELVISNGLSTMGLALPSAIGAKAANRKLRVLSVSGDGGFLMNAQELATAAKNKLGVVHVVLIDQKLGLIEKHQNKAGVKPHGVDVAPLNIAALAKGFGAQGRMIHDAREIAPAIKRALASGKPTVIGIPVDYSRVQRFARSRVPRKTRGPGRYRRRR